MRAEMIDLTIPIRHEMGRLGLKATFEKCATFQENGWQGSTLSMFVHLGTHVDAPVHFIEGGHEIDSVPLDRITGPAVLMDFSHKKGGEAITLKEVRRADEKLNVGEGEIIVFRTDWTDKFWGSEDFFSNSPYVTADVGEWMVEKKVRAGVFDFSEEYAVRHPGFEGRECLYHKTVLSHHIYNIEYVRNLSKITRERFLIMAMPLALVGMDGAPARVVAIEMEENLQVEFHLRK
jgi:arylformamidase